MSDKNVILLDRFNYGATSKNYVRDYYTNFLEKTFRESSYDEDSLRNPYNPDDLVDKKGDYIVYEEMLKDDQVSVALQLKKDLVLGSGWHIFTEDDQNEEISKFLEQTLREDVLYPLEDMLEEVLSGYAFGFSMSEKIFYKRDDGKIALKCLKTRHPNTWEITTDPRGNISKVIQHGMSQDIEIEYDNILHYINKPGFQNPYGTSDLRPAYEAWFTKKEIVKFYAIFMEKAASPIPIAKYDINAPQQARDDIFNAIKKFQTKTALAIPKQIDIEFLQTDNKGEAYINGINIFNMFIGRALLIPDLLGFQGAEQAGGSYSLGKEQIDVFFRHIERRKSTLERLVNEHIIKPLVIANFGLVEDFPKFKLNPIREENSIEFARLFVESVKGGLYEPSDEEINYFRSIIGFPEGEVVRPEPQQQMPGVGEDPNDPLEVPEEQSPNPDANGDEKDKKGADEEYVKNNHPFNPPSGLYDPEKASKIAFAYDAPTGDYHKKVNFKDIEKQMDSNVSRIMKETQPILKDIFRDLADQIETKKIVQGNRVDKIDELKIKYLAKMKQILKDNLRLNYKDAQLIARDEIFKGQFRTPVPADEFLDVLESETFQYIGDWEYNIRKGVRVRLIEAIKDGKPLSSVLDALEDEGLKNAEASLERFSRTKSTEIMNKARVAFYEDSKVVHGYQYSAILDDRTTEICRGLHGKTFKKGQEPIPPMHFNCRSVLIPITIFEEFEPTEKIGQKSVDQFIDDNIGEGFPKR